MKIILTSMNGNNFNLLFKLFYFTKNTIILKNTDDMISTLLEYILNDVKPETVHIEPEFINIYEDSVTSANLVPFSCDYWNSKFTTVFCVTASFGFKNNIMFFENITEIIRELFTEGLADNTKQILPVKKIKNSMVLTNRTSDIYHLKLSDRSGFINSARRNGLITNFNKTYDQLNQMNKTVNEGEDWKFTPKTNKLHIRLFNKNRPNLSSDIEKTKIDKFYYDYKNLNFKIKNIQIKANSRMFSVDKKVINSLQHETYLFNSESTAAEGKSEKKNTKIRPFLIRNK